MNSRLLGLAYGALLVVPFPTLSAATLASSYQITTIGLTDLEHTRNDGYRYNSTRTINNSGQAIGFADRYNGTATSYGSTAWLYTGGSTLNVGLTNAEHTRTSDGYRSSTAFFLNDAGRVAGTAGRYGASGQTVWLYNGSSTINVGLVDTEHTRNDGYRFSTLMFLGDGGQVGGNANRYNGGITSMGQSAWLYNGSSTFNVGLTAGDHTRSDGYRFSELQFFNQAGQAAGSSRRFTPTGATLGRSAWLYNGSSTVEIGLTDSEHTGINASRASDVMALNAAGQAVGSSVRYSSAGTGLGSSAWLYNGSTTVNIGMSDTEHTSNDGVRINAAQRINSVGQVAGTAARYNGGAVDLGQTAWLYNGSNTVEIGLTDSEHTRNDSYRYSATQHLNSAGHAAGTAYRYNGTDTQLGETAWLYNGSNTVSIGMQDAEHTREDGYRYGYLVSLNESGQAIGTAERYNGAAEFLGRTSWLFDGTRTINVGLTDAEHTRDDGYRSSYVQFLNASGQAVGNSERFRGATFMGYSAWFYDDASEQTFSLDFSQRSDGFSLSYISYLSDDGLALGYYNLFDSNDAFLGRRAFAFTLEDGAIDLGSMLGEELTSMDWAVLGGAFHTNDLGQIYGAGLLADMPSGSIGYVLTPLAVPQVPVPAAAWLLGSGLLGLVGLARRKRMV